MEIKVVIRGAKKSDDRMMLGEFATHFQHLQEMFAALATSPGEKPVQFELKRLSKNSPTEAGIAVVRQTGSRYNELRKPVRRISDRLNYICGVVPGDPISETDAAEIRAVCGAVTKAAKENRAIYVELDEKTYVLGKALAQRLRKVLASPLVEKSSMVGTAEVFFNRNIRSFRLYPLVGPKSVIVEAPNIAASMLGTLVGDRQLVEVFGSIFYSLGEKYPTKIIADSVSVLDDGDEIDLLSLRGALRGVPEPEGGWISEW